MIKPRQGRQQTDRSESDKEEDAGIESQLAESQTPALFSCPECGYNKLEKNLLFHFWQLLALKTLCLSLGVKVMLV